MIVILWLMVFLVFFLYVFVGYEYIFYIGKVFCVYNLEILSVGYGVYLVLVFVVVLFFIILVCYMKVFMMVYKYNVSFCF